MDKVDTEPAAAVGLEVGVDPPVGVAAVGAGCSSAGVGVSSKHPATNMAANATPAKKGSFVKVTNWASFKQTYWCSF